MAHESTWSKYRVAIVGAGPAGCICAKYLSEAGFEITLFDKGKFLRTLLPTGGGRCNLAHAEYDFRELAKNYPRGEKFLYSVFSRFGTQDTIDFFKNIGVNTYTQEDNRIFPVSNLATDVREKFLKSISKCSFAREGVNEISPISNGWKIQTNNNSYLFDYVIVATGGHAGYELLKKLDIKIQPPTQALVGLTTEEDLSQLSGVKVANAEVKIDKKTYKGDILFTHHGVSGPVIYTISSIYARKEFPYEMSFKFADFTDMPQYFLEKSRMEVCNQLKPYVPKSLTKYILTTLGKEPDIAGTWLGRTSHQKLLNTLENFKLHINGKMKNGEVVTCGGVDLKEINAKTLESKQYRGLYFCGEVLDIDGLCGGFHLQNCWSTGFIAAQSIIEN